MILGRILADIRQNVLFLWQFSKIRWAKGAPITDPFASVGSQSLIYLRLLENA